MNKQIADLPSGYVQDRFGIIRQVSHDKFTYDLDYKQKQATNSEMAYLRFGWLCSFFTYEEVKTFDIVDIGSGNGVFVDCCRGKFKSVSPYDLAGETITEEELYEKVWDIIVMSDVLEHFEEPADLFRLKWRYAMISFPETPDADTFRELSAWRHFKPNEHLSYFTAESFRKWLQGCTGEVFAVLGVSNFEDFIRVRWDEAAPNITTMMIRRNRYVKLEH